MCLVLNLFLATSWGIQDLSSLTRNQTLIPVVEVGSPNHWMTSEFCLVLKKKKGNFIETILN